MTDPWTLAVRFRRFAARRSARRALVVAVAVTSGLAAAWLIDAAGEARGRWGPTRTVVVARHDLQPGDVVRPGAVTQRKLPDAAVARSALADIPAGAVVRQPVAAGEPLIPERLAPQGVTGVAALVPEGHRAVAIPVGPTGAPPLRIGDHVDLLAILPMGDEDTHNLPYPLVERALVVDVDRDGQAVAVAVPEADAPVVAATLTQGVVVLSLAGV
ncbi:MAG TPA: SAF domain-containing protein [Acidimicrobiales bacterium]|jgi:Flp pilus assembly protein CpaB